MKTNRLTLEMLPEVRKRLERLRDRTGEDSMAEVIRRALAVYEYLWEEKGKGSRLVVHGDDERELVLI